MSFVAFPRRGFSFSAGRYGIFFWLVSPHLRHTLYTLPHLLYVLSCPVLFNQVIEDMCLIMLGGRLKKGVKHPLLQGVEGSWELERFVLESAPVDWREMVSQGALSTSARGDT